MSHQIGGRYRAIYKIAWILLLLFCVQCHSDACKASLSRPTTDVGIHIKDISVSFLGAKDSAQMGAFLRQHPFVASVFLDEKRYGSREKMIETWVSTLSHPALDSLGIWVRQTFYLGEKKESLSLSHDFKQAFGQLIDAFPSFSPPDSIFFMVSGLYKDIALSDDRIVIGLDYFLGEVSRYRPQGLPAYMLGRYTPQYVLPVAFMAISEPYNRVQGTTLLSEMIYFGKRYFFVKTALPCIADSTLMGYDSDTWEGVEKNEKEIWAYFVSHQLLYETHPNIKQRYVGERPRVPEIGAGCPGRIGQYIGWKIVQSYMDRQKSFDIKAMMEEDNAQKILTLSYYAPKED